MRLTLAKIALQEAQHAVEETQLLQEHAQSTLDAATVGGDEKAVQEARRIVADQVRFLFIFFFSPLLFFVIFRKLLVSKLKLPNLLQPLLWLRSKLITM